MKKLIGLALALVLLGVSPAYAHVTVSPSEVPEGGFAKLTFRVPNESDTESTVAFEVALPEGAPFANARVKPTPGWRAAVSRDDERVLSIKWDGGEINPGEFQEFDISLGPIPDVDVLEFKVAQTYTDGEVVRWIDPVVEGEEEPEHPAPTAAVVAGEVDGDDHGVGGDVGEVSGDAATVAADVDPDDDAEHGTDMVTFAALFLGGVALIAAVAALVMARTRVPT